MGSSLAESSRWGARGRKADGGGPGGQPLTSIPAHPVAQPRNCGAPLRCLERPHRWDAWRRWVQRMDNEVAGESANNRVDRVFGNVSQIEPAKKCLRIWPALHRDARGHPNEVDPPRAGARPGPVEDIELVTRDQEAVGASVERE